MEDISSVSHYHHCTYDGTGGYPLLLTSFRKSSSQTRRARMATMLEWT